MTVGVQLMEELMKKLLIIPALAMAFLLPGYTQENNNKEDEKLGYAVYEEKILEDFEQVDYTDKNLAELQEDLGQKASVQIKDQFPAPTQNSKKYLGVKVFGRNYDVFKIRPAKELLINQYCKEIAVWIYGKKFSGEFYMIFIDAAGTTHKISFGKLNFLGWRKLKVTIPKEINQEDEFLNQKKFMKIHEFQYRPTNTTRLRKWHYFYIDNISILVRQKYRDKMSDEW